MAKAIKQSALAYAEVKKIVEGLTIKDPKSISEIFAMSSNVKSTQQVYDGLVSLRRVGKVGRIKEEGSFRYFWNVGEDALKAQMGGTIAPKEFAAVLQPVKATPVPTIDRPEVRVEESRIIIEHKKCRVVVDLL